jgi:hypothetical protein
MNEKISYLENELNIKEKMLVGKHIEIMGLENQIKKRKADSTNEFEKKRDKSPRIENPSTTSKPSKNIVGAANTIHIVHEDFSENVVDKLNIDIILDYLLSHNFINSRHDYVTGQAANKCIFMKFKKPDVVDKLVLRRYFAIHQVDVKISRARNELQWVKPI